MSGYNTVQKIRRLEEQVDKLGFMFAHANHYHREFGDVVALKPKDQHSVPILTRDAEVFIGTLEQLEQWLRGVEWARRYDNILGLSDDKKRERREQDARNRQLVRILKNQKSDLVNA